MPTTTSNLPHFATNTPSRLIRLPAVKARTGLGKTAIYELAANGEFPAQVPLGARAVAWVESEIEAWIVERVNARPQKTKRAAA